MLVGGVFALLGSVLCISSALTPWISTPAFSVGLLTTCSTVSGVSVCGSLSVVTGGLSIGPSATAAAALLLLGFLSSLVLFVLSLINSYRCLVGPCTNRARLALAALSLVFTLVGTIVGSSSLSSNGLNLAGLLSSSPGSVGPGLGLGCAAVLLQLIALAVVYFSVCCQKRPSKVVVKEVIREVTVEVVVEVERCKECRKKAAKGGSSKGEDSQGSPGKGKEEGGGSKGKSPAKEEEEGKAKKEGKKAEAEGGAAAAGKEDKEVKNPLSSATKGKE
jgi:hypothetical protein